MRLVALALCVGAVLFARTPDARAEPAYDARRAEAAERFDRALRLVNAGDLSGGLAEFQRAYALVPLPVVIYNVGLVLRALHRPVEAARALEEAIVRPEALPPQNVELARVALRGLLDQIGQVNLSANVLEGTVEVDSVQVARWPLTGPLDLASGLHVVGIVTPGFAPARSEVLVAGRERGQVHLELVPIQGLLAHVAVRCRVPAADVIVDGARVGRTPLEATITVVPGRHRVEVRRAGYAPAGRDVELREGALAELSLTPPVDLAAQATEGGALVVTTSEPQAVIQVDGQDMGLADRTLRLPAGPHRVRFERADFFAEERDVDVPEKGTTELSVTFAPTPDARARYESSARTRRTVSTVLVGVGAALAAGGLAFGLVEQNEVPGARARYDAALKSRGFHTTGNPICDQSTTSYDENACQGLIDDAYSSLTNAETGRTLGWVVAGAGAAAALTGLILRVTGDDPHRYDRVHASVRDPRWWFDAGGTTRSVSLRAGVRF